MTSEENPPADAAAAPAPVAKVEKVDTAPLAAAEAESPSPAPISKSERQVSESNPTLESKEAESPEPAAAAETKEAEAKGEGNTPAIPPKDAAKEAAPAPLLTPLARFYDELAAVFNEAEYREMWGVELVETKEDAPTQIVITKFLRANNNDVTKAKKQLIEALKWRKKMEPQKLLGNTEFDKAKFGSLGFVTVYEGAKGKEIITWNIYGGVKSKKATFGNVDEFIKWRVALMEVSLAQLSLKTATVPIPESGPDPYQMIQVHDYLNVSFLRMDPDVKASSKQTIQIFSMAYPELLKEKFFVNVPVVMSWVFAAMKVFLSADTVRKFHPLAYGSKLAGEMPEVGDKLPNAYGGKGGDIKDGLTVKYAAEAAPPAPATTEETKVEDATVKKDVTEEAAKEEVAKEEETKDKDVIAATPSPPVATKDEKENDKETMA